MIRRIWLSCFRASMSASILLPLLLARPVSAQTNPTVNRTVPAHSAPNAGFVLSANPSVKENRQVADALRQHVQRAVADDFAALEAYVAVHPESPWTPSLLFNLGMEYY